MDFNFTREQKIIQNSVREFLRDKIAPIADEYDKKGPMSKDDAHRFLKSLIPFGYIGTLVPEKYGGAGMSHTEWGIIFKELRKVYASLGGISGINLQRLFRNIQCQERNAQRKVSSTAFEC